MSNQQQNRSNAETDNSRKALRKALEAMSDAVGAPHRFRDSNSTLLKLFFETMNVPYHHSDSEERLTGLLISTFITPELGQATSAPAAQTTPTPPDKNKEKE